MSDVEAKYFVRAFLRFIEKQIEERRFTPDIVESLDVATQCLETAYDLPSSAEGQEQDEQNIAAHAAADADTNPMAHINLFELFLNVCHEVTPERKQEAENIKNEGNCLMRQEKYFEALQCYNR